MMNERHSNRFSRFMLILLMLGFFAGMTLAQDGQDAPADPDGPVETIEAPADPVDDEAPADTEEQTDPDAASEDATTEDATTEDDGIEGEDVDVEVEIETEQDAADERDATQAGDVPPAAIGEQGMIDFPLQPGMREMGDNAWVRVLNLAPGTEGVTFTLVSTDVDNPAPTPPEFEGLGYESHAGYLELPPGTFEVRVPELNDNELGTIDLNSGRFYTIALIGLEAPPELTDEDSGGGFFAWVGSLFGGDDGSDRFMLDVLVLEDDLYQFDMGSESMLRVVNAAPGVGEVSIAVTGESGQVTGSAAYGNATGYNRVDAAQFTGPLEMRLEGSRVATIDLDGLNLVPGTVNTVFLVGTPLESAPIRAITVSTPSFGDM